MNCTLYNVTSTSVRVSCLAGADNGARQQFALQVLFLLGCAVLYENQQISFILIDKQLQVFKVNDTYL